MRDVSKTYPGGLLALNRVSLDIRKGEFVFIVGQSGAGKSTLVKLLYREEVPTEGRVIVAGKDVTRMRRREVPLLRRRIGVVFQDFKLLPDRTVAENVELLRVTGYSGRAAKRALQFCPWWASKSRQNALPGRALSANNSEWPLRDPWCGTLTSIADELPASGPRTSMEISGGRTREQVRDNGGGRHPRSPRG